MTTKALDVRFVSVDIAEVVEENKPDKKYRILEVNPGVTMDHLMEQQGSVGVQLATLIYAKALKASLQV